MVRVPVRPGLEDEEVLLSTFTVRNWSPLPELGVTPHHIKYCAVPPQATVALQFLSEET